MTIDGLITVRSSFEHSETLARFEAAVRANGLRIVAGVDHAIAAFEAGLSLDATTVQMVGDGRLQARADESSSIDRPRAAFKVPVWQDASGIWSSSIDFRWLAKHYGAVLEEGCLITDIAVMIDGMQERQGRRRSGVDFTHW